MRRAALRRQFAIKLCHMSPLELQSAIVDLVNRSEYQPVKPRVIAKRLGLPKEEVADVRSMVKRLVKQGLVTYASNHIVRPAQPSPPAPLPNGEGSTSSSRSAPLLEGGEGQVADKRVSDLFRWPEPGAKTGSCL